MNKPNCYECKWRGGIPGDAHSRCRHPLVQVDANPISAIVDMIGGKTAEAAVKLGIKGDLHGIRREWFMWPANFDPVWLLACNGFEQKEETDGK